MAPSWESEGTEEDRHKIQLPICLLIWIRVLKYLLRLELSDILQFEGESIAGDSCYAWTLRDRVIPEYITDLTVLNAHNTRVFIVFFLLSFLFIDTLKFNLYEHKQIQHKHHKYHLCNKNSSFYDRYFGLVLKMQSDYQKLNPACPKLARRMQLSR